MQVSEAQQNHGELMRLPDPEKMPAQEDETEARSIPLEFPESDESHSGPSPRKNLPESTVQKVISAMNYLNRM